MENIKILQEQLKQICKEDTHICEQITVLEDILHQNGEKYYEISKTIENIKWLNQMKLSNKQIDGQEFWYITKNGQDSDLFYMSDSDKFKVEYQLGSFDYYEFQWKLRRLELLNEIKEYTSNWKNDKLNLIFYHDKKTNEIDTLALSDIQIPSEYGYFHTEEDVDNCIKALNQERLLLLLFDPIDNDYQKIMKIINEIEEIDLPF